MITCDRLPTASRWVYIIVTVTVTVKLYQCLVFFCYINIKPCIDEYLPQNLQCKCGEMTNLDKWNLKKENKTHTFPLYSHFSFVPKSFVRGLAQGVFYHKVFIDFSHEILCIKTAAISGVEADTQHRSIHETLAMRKIMSHYLVETNACRDR